MGIFAALDVSQDETAVCVVSQDGTILAETKVSTCPDAIADWLSTWRDGLERVGMETGHWLSGCGTRWFRGICRSSASMHATRAAY